MNYLNRCYIRKCRRSAVKAAVNRLPHRVKRRFAVRLALGASICLELWWAGERLPSLSDWFRSLVQIQTIEEYEAFAPGSGEAGEGTVIREGINIWLDEKAISIFRMKERAEQAND